MTASQVRPRRSWAPPRPWNLSTYWPLLPLLAMLGVWAVCWTWIVLSPSQQRLSTACDRVVERLLTTHDAVELERSRILVKTIGCDVSRRLASWPAGRTGWLMSDAVQAGR